MSLLTRRERDAAIVLATAFSVTLVAGFITGYAGFSSVSSAEYRLAVWLFVMISGLYLFFRGVVRLGRSVVTRAREARSE